MFSKKLFSKGEISSTNVILVHVQTSEYCLTSIFKNAQINLKIRLINLTKLFTHNNALIYITFKSIFNKRLLYT